MENKKIKNNYYSNRAEAFILIRKLLLAGAKEETLRVHIMETYGFGKLFCDKCISELVNANILVSLGDGYYGRKEDDKKETDKD